MERLCKEGNERQMQGKANEHREPNTEKKLDNSELLSHYLVIMTDKKGPKGPQEFICENCDFMCYKKSKYERHLGTAKHKILTNTDKTCENTWGCVCGKIYKHRQSYHKHKLKCNYKTPEELKEEELIQHLKYQSIKLEEIKEEQKKQKGRDEEQKKHNEELKEQISGMSLVTNNNTINNNVFNLKVFLNNDCKDAMGMTEFLHSIRVSEEDLITFENEGYVKGISSIIDRHLSEMAITERPIHCTDKKRQTIYFKSEKEGWKKDDKNIQVSRLIDTVENKSNNKFIDTHKEKGNPEDAFNPESPRHKWYKRLAIETSGGDYGNKEINEKKLLRLTTDILYIKVKKEVIRYN